MIRMRREVPCGWWDQANKVDNGNGEIETP